MPAVKQLTVWTQNRPGRLAEVAGALGERDINIQALWAGLAGDRWAIRLIVDKLALAKEHLEERGWEVTEDDVLAASVTNKPGGLGSVAGRLEDAGMNIEYAYTSRANGTGVISIYFAVGDVESAVKALSELSDQENVA